VLRKYSIPAGVAKSGINSITIRIYDYTGGGGFMGEAKDFLITSDKGKSTPLKIIQLERVFGFQKNGDARVDRSEQDLDQ